MRLAFIILSGYHLNIELTRTSSFFMQWNSVLKDWNQVCHVRHPARVVLVLTKDSVIPAKIRQPSYCCMNQASVSRQLSVHLVSISQTSFMISVAPVVGVVINVSPILDFAHNVKAGIFSIRQVNNAFWNLIVKEKKA